MICPNCKKEWSDRVYAHHVARCITEQKPAKKTEKKPVNKTAKK
jgi:hypothetical protein